MNGEVNVNNDPYGASPLRMRLYFSGMAIAAMLDSLNADWQTAMFGSISLLFLMHLKRTQPPDGT